MKNGVSVSSAMLCVVAVAISVFAVATSRGNAELQRRTAEFQNDLQGLQRFNANLQRDLRVSHVAPDPTRLAEEVPDREIRLPKDELAPQELVVITAEAGDVRDWGIDYLKIPEAWKVTKGKGATVVVLDTGCDAGHRDLGRVKVLKDFTGSRSGAADVNGHGSHCLGVVGAAENNVGMVGVAPECTLISGKVLGDNGAGLSSWIALGIDWAVEQGADVISMSLGSDAPDPRIEAAVKRARAKGVIVVAAAGNSGPRENTAGWPGSFEGVICVAAHDDGGKIANFSSRGKSVVVAAPGVNVRSCYPGDRFAVMSGTSMATPYVAGIAALYVASRKANGVQWSQEEFAKLISTTSVDLPPNGRDTASGFGVIQPVKMVATKPEPKEPPKDPPANGDTVVIVPPVDLPLTAGGRKVKRIILELEPKP